MPPHPGPLVAIDALKANLGLTLGLGVLVAVPTVALAGPLFARYADRWVHLPAPEAEGEARGDARLLRPGFGITVATVLLPVVLMLGKALVDIFATDGTALRTTFDFLGTPLIALLIAVFVAMFTLGRGAGMGLRETTRRSSSRCRRSPASCSSSPPVAASSRPWSTPASAAWWPPGCENSGLSVLLLAWLVAVLIRLATGSATVATVTASGILAPLVTHLSTGETSLLVLAIGSGLAVLLPRQRRRLLAGQGVLRPQRRPDHQVVVADGDGHLGQRAGLRAGAQPGDLTGPQHHEGALSRPGEGALSLPHAGTPPARGSGRRTCRRTRGPAARRTGVGQ